MASRATQVKATAFMISLLAALSAIGQFATNIYLPSLPSMTVELATEPSRAQLTLTVYLLVFAFTQLFYGPISDRFGRRPVLTWGILIFIAGSAVCALAPDIDMLILGRAVQALGGGACTVAARAVVRDSFDGTDLIRVMALIAVLFALVPALSPLIGALLQELHGWRLIFIVTAAAGILVAFLMLTRLPETIVHRMPRFDIPNLVGSYGAVLTNRAFMRYAIPIGLTFIGMFAFFGGSPHTFINHLGISATEYGLYPPMASSGFVIGGIFVRQASRRMAPTRIAAIGYVGLLLACAFGLAMPLMGFVHKIWFVAAIVGFVTCMGIALPLSMSSALQIFPERAGTASATLGFLQMAGAGVGSALVAVYQEDHPILAYPTIMVVSSVMALAVYLWLRPRR